MLYVLTRTYQILTRGGTPDRGESCQLIGVFSDLSKAEQAKLDYKSTDEYKTTFHLGFDVDTVDIDTINSHVLMHYYE